MQTSSEKVDNNNNAMFYIKKLRRDILLGASYLVTTQSLTHSITHSLTHSITQSLTHIHPFTHSLTHSGTQPKGERQEEGDRGVGGNVFGKVRD